MKTQTKAPKAQAQRAPERAGAVVRREMAAGTLRRMGNEKLGATAELPASLPKFTESIGDYSVDDLNSATLTVFGELSSEPNEEWESEAHHIASEIFNRLELVKNSYSKGTIDERKKYENYKQIERNIQTFSTAKKEEINKHKIKSSGILTKILSEQYKNEQKNVDNAVLNIQRVTKCIQKINDVNNKKFSFMNKKEPVGPVGLDQIATAYFDKNAGKRRKHPHIKPKWIPQFAGYKQGVTDFNKYTHENLYLQTRRLKKWNLSRKVVESIARDPSSVDKNIYYNYSAEKLPDSRTLKSEYEFKLGGNIFSENEILSTPRDYVKLNKSSADIPECTDIDISTLPVSTEKPRTNTNTLSIHHSLELGPVNHPAEHAADALADRVLRMPEGGECCPACASGQPCGRALETTLRRQAGEGGGLDVPSDVEPQVRRATSGGEPLPQTVRAFFEPRFGQDLSHVRIHRDAEAAQSARALGAKAYTLGSHIAFSAGRWAPGTAAGDRLIAHELAHATAEDAGAVRRAAESGGGAATQEKSLWDKHVETPIAEGLDRRRAAMHPGDRPAHDVAVGAAKGVYHFAKSLLDGIGEMLIWAAKMKAHDPETLARTRDAIMRLDRLIWVIQFGSAQEKQDLNERFIAALKAGYANFRQDLLREWGAAKADGKQAEFVTRTTVETLLNIGSFFVGAGEAKAVSGAGKAAEGAAALARGSEAVEAAKAMNVAASVAAGEVEAVKAGRTVAEAAEMSEVTEAGRAPKSGQKKKNRGQRLREDTIYHDARTAEQAERLRKRGYIVETERLQLIHKNGAETYPDLIAKHPVTGEVIISETKTKGALMKGEGQRLMFEEGPESFRIGDGEKTRERAARLGLKNDDLSSGRTKRRYLGDPNGPED